MRRMFALAVSRVATAPLPEKPTAPRLMPLCRQTEVLESVSLGKTCQTY
jgi:hypothetical protein